MLNGQKVVFWYDMIENVLWRHDAAPPHPPAKNPNANDDDVNKVKVNSSPS